MEEYVRVLYFGGRIVSYILLFFGLVALITGFPDRFWALLIPCGFLGLGWSWVIKKEAERDEP